MFWALPFENHQEAKSIDSRLDGNGYLWDFWQLRLAEVRVMLGQ